MKKIIVIAIILMISCQKNDDETCCTQIDADVFISVQNSVGKDLLDESSEAIALNSIKIKYKMKGGDISEVNDPSLDAPHGFYFYNPHDASDLYKVQIFLNTVYLNNSDISYTYVEWTPNSIDEIRTKFTRTKNTLTAQKIWINDDLVWVHNEGSQLITIVKENL